MKFLLKVVIFIGGNALALWVATRLVDGFVFTEPTLINFLKVGLVLGLVNAIIKPLINLIALPLRVLTLGLFTVIINIGFLYLVSFFFDFFVIEGLFAAFWAIIVMSLVNFLISLFFKED